MTNHFPNQTVTDPATTPTPMGAHITTVAPVIPTTPRPVVTPTRARALALPVPALALLESPSEMVREDAV